MKLNYGFDEIDQLLEILLQIMPLLIPVLLLQLVMLVVALINFLKKDLPMKEKGIWLIILFGLQIIGPVLYFIVGSKMLDDKIAKGAERSDIRN